MSCPFRYPGLRMRPRLLLIAVLAVAALPSRLVTAEDFDPHEQPRLFAVRDTNAARNAIQAARDALDAGRISMGLREAQRVLDDMPDDFFLVADESSPRSVLWRSAAEEVRFILEGLTPEQRAVYEEMTRPSAAPMLERALALRDIDHLKAVQHRFGASRIGVAAGRFIARYELSRGSWRDAARHAQEALRFAPNDAGLWVLLIDALIGAGDREALLALTPPATMGSDAPGAGEDVRSRLEQALARVPDRTTSLDWPAWGGDASRSRRIESDPPLPRQLRWKERTDFRERSRDRTGRSFREGELQDIFKAKLSNFRPSHPVVADRTVFVGDGRSVRAFDLYSGRMLWRFDADFYSDADVQPPFRMYAPGRFAEGRTSLERAFAPVVVGDTIIATVEEWHPYVADRLQRIEISMYLPRRILVALDKRTGALRWHMGQDGLEHLTLAQTSIVSPPAVSEGLVVAVGSVYHGSHNVSFLAFDLETGRLRWRRALGTGQQELNLFGIPVKELAASAVTVSDGVAYASTGLGFVAAVDIRTGVPRWLASYDIIPVRPVQYWYTAPLRIPSVAPSPPAVRGDYVVVAPTDGTHLYAFDRRTGTMRWRKPYKPGSASGHAQYYNKFVHFLGIVNDGKRDVVLTTDLTLHAYQLDSVDERDGDPEPVEVWAALAGSLVSGVVGQGAVAGDEVVVPTLGGMQRFSLSKEGKHLGNHPWPENAEPGNLLPLERVLLVAAREEVQWFYDWEDLERDVAKRRREHPDDPTILIEAAELYLRAGEETERSRKAFHEALRIAQRVAPEFVKRAQRGLYLSWMLEGERAEAVAAKASAAYREALQYAQSPVERIHARVRLHDVLQDLPDERLANLEALIREAGDAEFVFDETAGPQRARTEGMFLLAQAYLDRGEVEPAVGVLQQVLAEAGDELDEDSARERARRTIDDIIASFGRAAYRKQEERAKELMRRAADADDVALLDRVIREYPNASTLPAALLARGESLIQNGQPSLAVPSLRRLLADQPHGVHAAKALALVARAYRAEGALGGARVALIQMSRSHAGARFEIDGREWSGEQFARAELARLPRREKAKGKKHALEAPLHEVHAERVSPDANARALDVITSNDADEDVEPSPLAVMVYAQSLTAFDLRKGDIAWKQNVNGSCQRAAYVDGLLVVARTPFMEGRAAEDGTQVWERDVGGHVREMALANGVVYALVQDTRGLAGGSHLIAMDAYRGHELWRRDLGPDNPRRLRTWRGRILLERSRWDMRQPIGSLLILDGFSGGLQDELRIPVHVDTPSVLVDGALCVAHGERDPQRHTTRRRLVAFDIAKGKKRWAKTLPSQEKMSPNVTGLMPDGKRLVVLRSDGTLMTFAMSDGALEQETRIFVGDRVHVRPFRNSPLLLDAKSLTFLPTPPRPRSRGEIEPTLMSFDRRTGKLRWERSYRAGIDVSTVQLWHQDDVICAFVTHRESMVPHILVRLLNASTGELLQAIEPVGLSQQRWIPSAEVGYGTLVVFGRAGASVFVKKGSNR